MRKAREQEKAKTIGSALEKEVHREKAECNRSFRTYLYFRASIWAAIGAFMPMAYFIGDNIINAPEPISVTYKGMHTDPAPVYGSYPVYDMEWASMADQVLSFASFAAGVPAAALIGALFFCIARFIADPIMYQIDMHSDEECMPAIWAKRGIITLVVLLYFATMAFAVSYEAYPEDEYVWLSMGEDTVVRVDREDYEKYSKDKTDSDADKEQPATEKEETTTESGEEDSAKTPVERGYPSNDLQYYIDHPDEPMPQELIDEVTGGYDPGDYYDSGPY